MKKPKKDSLKALVRDLAETVNVWTVGEVTKPTTEADRRNAGQLVLRARRLLKVGK